MIGSLFIYDIIDTAPPLPPTCLNCDLYDRFRDEEDLLVVPVVTDDGQILGLIERNAFFLSMAMEFGRALFGKKPITTLMDANPLVVDGHQSLNDFTRYILLERPSELMRGFVATLNGAYLGVGTALSVLKASSEELQRAGEEMRHMAHYDALTGLANRSMFTREMEQALARADRNDKKIALLCLDLDRFKAINDGFGHGIGDELLCLVAERLRQCVRKGDLIARMGGDEFAIIQAIQSIEDASRLAQRIVKALARPFIINDRPLTIGASVGITVSPDNGSEMKTLMSRADLALYRVKSEGRNGFCFFEAEMDDNIRQRLEMEQDLKNALYSDELTLHFQPLLDLNSGEIVSFEALLRWHHPTKGNIPPSDFIPFAEDTGLILPLGEWVLNKACAAAASWPKPWRVAVNISPLQFRTTELIEKVTTALQSAKLPPSRLELEITESVIMDHDTQNIATLNTMRDMGIRIAMDDFGTGYSSLSYLRAFPFDKIKIDQSFIRDLPHDRSALSIVRAITEMAQSLGVRITAEGVETEAQLEALKALNCREAQGYLIGRPAASVAAYAPVEQEVRLYGT